MSEGLHRKQKPAQRYNRNPDKDLPREASYSPGQKYAMDQDRKKRGAARLIKEKAARADTERALVDQLKAEKAAQELVARMRATNELSIDPNKPDESYPPEIYD